MTRRTFRWHPGLFMLAASLVCASAHARLNVVATTPELAAIASAVGGANVEVTTLVRPTEDPHFVDPKPSFILKLNKADVLLEGGADLESAWLAPLLQGSRNAKIQGSGRGHIAANEGIAMLEIPSALDRSKGDIHAAGNPHYLMDPVNAGILAANLARRFATLDPNSAAEYQRNASRFRESLDRAIEGWKKALAPFAGQTLVGFHNSWPYFAQRFGLKVDLFLEPKPGIPPSPSHLAGVISAMKQRGARAILVDTYQDRRTAETVAARTGARVLDVSHFPGGIKGTEKGYIEFMDALVREVVAGLADAPSRP